MIINLHYKWLMNSFNPLSFLTHMIFCFLWHTKGDICNTVPVTLFHAMTMNSHWSFKRHKCTIKVVHAYIKGLLNSLQPVYWVSEFDWRIRLVRFMNKSLTEKLWHKRMIIHLQTDNRCFSQEQQMSWLTVNNKFHSYIMTFKDLELQ